METLKIENIANIENTISEKDMQDIVDMKSTEQEIIKLVKSHMGTSMQDGQKVEITKIFIDNTESELFSDYCNDEDLLITVVAKIDGRKVSEVFLVQMDSDYTHGADCQIQPCTYKATSQEKYLILDAAKLGELAENYYKILRA